MANNHCITLEVITQDALKLEDICAAVGWGDDAQTINITGKLRHLMFVKDGKPQFGIGINSDGSLVFTDYAGMGYFTYVPPNIHAIPSRPWTKNKTSTPAKGDKNDGQGRLRS